MPGFRSYLPTPELRPYVKCYLLLEADFGPGVVLDAVPRGLPVLAFSLLPDQRIHWTRQKGTPALGKPAVMGQTTHTVRCLMYGVHKTLYVVFQPTGLHPFLRDSMQLLTNREYAVDEFPWITREPDLAEQLVQATTDAGRVLLIETLLAKRLRQFRDATTNQTGEVVRLIDAGNGLARIEDVATYFRVSRRSLERHFQEQVGLSPKHYANIVRFRFVMSHLHANPDSSWLDLTHLGNFTDQSHLIRHFREFTDLPPALFRARDHRLDKLFLEMT